MTKPVSGDPTAYVLYEALQRLGSKADPEAIVALVKKLGYGLPAEDEFIAVLAWLGQCRLVHKLDQMQLPPRSRERYRVPDLLAVFDHHGERVTALIEVKAKKKGQLSWKPEYFDGLQRYADDLGLPILLAWKHKPTAVWTLCDLGLFTKSDQNYKLTFETAAQHSLMGVLAGDFGYMLEPGVGMHLHMKKLEAGSLETPPPEGQVAVEITQAYFTDAQGHHLDRLGDILWPLFLGANQDVELHEDDHVIRQSFVIPAHQELHFAHRALPILVGLKFGGRENISWREILKEGLPLSEVAPKETAMKAIGKGILRVGGELFPKAWPSFLSRPSQ